MKRPYLMCDDNYTMKCSEQDLIANLIETYTYYFKQSHDMCEEMGELYGDCESTQAEEDAYQLGRLDGAVEVLSTMMLSVLGGGNMYDIWQKTLEWADK